LNAPVQRLFVAVLVLFALLVAFVSRWSVFEAERLQADSENKRPLLEQQRIARGDVRSSDGELLAVSRGRGRGEAKR
jgi:penicillin-binding protein A